MTDQVATHWLLFPEPPEAHALEALVVSREVGVAWVDERTLGWQPGVLLSGPLTDQELVGARGLPEWVGAVYAVLTPQERGPAIPPELQLPGSVLTAFPDGEPTGVERQTLETVEALARRLGGGVVVATGELVIPEPRLDLVLFTTTWLDEDELATHVAPIADFRPEGGPVAPPGIDVEGYGLIADLPDGAVLGITASPAEVTPASIAGYPWANGAVYVYEFRHYPAAGFTFAAPLPTSPHEAQDRVDVQASHAIDELAQAVFTTCGGADCGHLVDDDGFLVTV